MTNAKNRTDPKIIEAEEHLLIDCQLLLQETIAKKNLTRSALAQRAGLSKARLSQLMRPEANPTVKTMARLFHAAGEQLVVSTQDENSSAMGGASDVGEQAQHWNCTEAPSLSTKIDDAQFVAVLKDAAKGSSASNDNYSSVIVMEADLDVIGDLLEEAA
jgi:transcriptional regulator with XRE-family HTH domain